MVNGHIIVIMFLEKIYKVINERIELGINSDISVDWLHKSGIARLENGLSKEINQLVFVIQSFNRNDWVIFVCQNVATKHLITEHDPIIR